MMLAISGQASMCGCCTRGGTALMPANTHLAPLGMTCYSRAHRFRHLRRTSRGLVATVAAAAAASGAGSSETLPTLAGTGPLRRLTRRLAPALSRSEYDAELLALAMPALAAMMLDPLMNVVSAAYLGNLGTQQLGAVSLASLATSLATYVFSFLVFLTTPRIAAAHAVGDRAAVSRLAAVGLWLAGSTGLAVGVGMWFGADAIVSALKPPEPEVAAYAIQYIQVRAWGIAAAMLGFVASGTYRGVKDTRTPLRAAAAAAVTHAVLTPALMFGLGWGVCGAGLAATSAQWVSCVTLLVLLLRRGLLEPADLLPPPRAAEVTPYLWKGAVLAFRMIVTFGMIMAASATCVRAGAASQAAFEIIRQVWIISVQLFESLNVATQAMAAGLLGRGERNAARRLLARAAALSAASGLAVGAVLCAGSGPIVELFTRDAAVAALAGAAIPLVAFCMPLDALASIMDGGLIAAGQTNALSAIQILGSLLQYAALAVLLAAGRGGDVAAVWGVLKLLSLARAGGGWWLHFVSRSTAYGATPPPEPLVPAGSKDWQEDQTSETSGFEQQQQLQQEDDVQQQQQQQKEDTGDARARHAPTAGDFDESRLNSRTAHHQQQHSSSTAAAAASLHVANKHGSSTSSSTTAAVAVLDSDALVIVPTPALGAEVAPVLAACEATEVPVGLTAGSAAHGGSGASASSDCSPQDMPSAAHPAAVNDAATSSRE